MENHLFSLKGKNILITGASGYLGQEIAESLASLGACVFLNGRSIDKINELHKKIRNKNFLSYPAIFDISSKEERENWFNNSCPESLHGLVNLAYSGKGGTLETSQGKDYEQSYLITIIHLQDLIKNALPFLRKAVIEIEDASVINISSMYGMVSPDLRLYESPQTSNPPFYGAAKAALIQLTKYAACEFAKEKIRFNTISPGPFPSKTVQKENPLFIEKLSSKLPMGRIGQAKELSSSVCFLMASSSSFITGINLPVDGGWTAW